MGVEQRAPVGRDTPFRVAGIDAVPDVEEGVPQVLSVRIEAQSIATMGLGGVVPGTSLQRHVRIGVIRPIGQQATVFGVGHEEQAEQDHQGDVVRLAQFSLGGGLQLLGHGRGQVRDHIDVDPFTQALSQCGGVIHGTAEDFIGGTALAQRLWGHQQRRIRGVLVIDRGEVDFGVGVAALTSNTSVRIGGV